MQTNTVIQQQRQFFNEYHTRTYDYRIMQLSKLKHLLIENEQAIYLALKKDLNKSEFEVYISEYSLVMNELNMAIKKLKKWIKPKRVRTPLSHFPCKSFCVYEPLGTVLILSPWNYPFQLTMVPLIGAMAAGNTAMLKTSKNSPCTSKLIHDLINTNFDHKTLYVFDVDTPYDEVLEPQYDYIFFTGSTSVGKTIMESASRYLTPFTLELGGKSPCIIDKEVDLAITCRRIVFGKLMNAGQTCIAPDYCIVHQAIADDFIVALKKAFDDICTDYIENETFPKIINQKQFDRLVSIINQSSVAYGGKYDALKRKIEPTIIYPVKLTDAAMKEEIFGPLLPIIIYQDIAHCIAQINAHPKPLACYIYTNRKHIYTQFINEVTYGGGCINDCLMHIGNHHLPFGGVGNSGQGRYHGYASFLTFSNEKSIVRNTLKFDLPLRYHQKYLKFIKRIMH